jgi:putative ABC transport system substrate-binding protein
MTRNILIWLLATVVLATVPPAAGQQVGKVPRVGVLSPGGSEHNPQIEGFQQAIRELGYVEGQTIHLEYRFAQGKADRIPELAAELVHLKVDVIVTFSHHVALIVKNATTAIPIIFVFVNDPVGVGWSQVWRGPEGMSPGCLFKG